MNARILSRNDRMLRLVFVSVFVAAVSCSPPTIEQPPRQPPESSTIDSTVNEAASSSNLSKSSLNQQDDSSQSSQEKEDLAFFQQVGRLKSKAISESSGLAVSMLNSNLFWTINDSGGTAQVFGLTFEGQLLATVDLEGASNRDWESMSRVTIDDEPFLLVADTGDNLSSHEKYRLYLFREPQLEANQADVTLTVKPLAIEFVYADGARDCEAVAIDPLTRDIWLFEKIMSLNPRRKPGVYRLKADQWLPRFLAGNPSDSQQGSTITIRSPDEPLVASRHCELGHRFVTDGDFSPDGNLLIIRTYTHGAVFTRKLDQTWDDVIKTAFPTWVVLPLQRQGESIAFINNSRSVLLTSEFSNQPIWLVDVAGFLNIHRKHQSPLPGTLGK